MSVGRISAVILAAGYSSRMGVFKPLLKIGEATVLERIVRLFQEPGIENVVVVVGHQWHELTPFVEQWGASWIKNEHFERGMFSSVQTGVRALPSDVTAFFVLPADIPLVRPQTIRDLLHHFNQLQGSIVYPVFQGRKGHPPLISSRYRDEILLHDGSGGLAAVLRRHEREAAHVEVADAHILADMDTPDHYEALIERFRRYDIPTPGELEVLVEKIFQLQGDLLGHSRAVAQLALKLAEALNTCGSSLDTDLVFSAGFLYDIAKDAAGQALIGTETLRRMGFKAVAGVVASHRDLVVNDHEPVKESEVVYLADKLVQQKRFSSLETRFKAATRRCKGDPAAMSALCGRYKHALKVKQRMERVLGMPVESVAPHPGEATDTGAG